MAVVPTFFPLRQRDETICFVEQVDAIGGILRKLFLLGLNACFEHATLGENVGKVSQILLLHLRILANAAVHIVDSLLMLVELGIDFGLLLYFTLCRVEQLLEKSWKSCCKRSCIWAK